ncbi:hypothetical protein OROGR_025452 [Orobanche gracilis]
MSDQEPKFFHGLQDEDTICRSMHHLFAPASHHRHHHQPTTSSDSPDKYIATAYANPTKRQYPLSPSSFQEPLPKRATIHFPSSPTTAAVGDCAADAEDDDHHFGFTRLPLPHPFPATTSPPPLRRTLSEPLHSPDAINHPAPQPQSSGFQLSPDPAPRQPLQENPNRSIILQESYPFPNAEPVIHRTISDPSPVANIQAEAADGTPPRRPPLARNVSRSPSGGESPSTKRLRRMNERLREMSNWWNQVVREGEEEDHESENYSIDKIHKEESENETGNSSQEAVWVEKNGECLVIHFKCPCGSAYQILLSGNNCYYKLTNF